MTRLSITLVFTFNLVLGQVQQLTGRYESEKNYVAITDSSLEFMTSYGCCMPIELYGYGKYEVHNDSIYVATKGPSKGHGSSYKILGDLPTTEQICINVEMNGKPIQFGISTINDKRTNKIINSAIIDNSGKVMFTNIPKDHIENNMLFVSTLGADKFQVPLNELIGKSVLVNLADYQVLQDELVAFKFINDDNSSVLIGPFFPPTIEEKRKMKKEKYKRNRQMIIHNWPWNWRFKDEDFHVAKPKTFVLK